MALAAACLLASSSTAFGCPNESLRGAEPSGLTLPDCRAYEQVTPLDKDGNNPTGATNYVQASPDGSHIIYLVPANMPGAEGSSNFPTFLSIRSPTGWASEGVLPPSPPGIFDLVTGWSPDLSKIVLRAGFPGDEGAAVYLDDTATRTYVRVGSTVPGNFFASNAPAGFSADGSKLVFESEHQLLPNAAAGVDNLYEWDENAGLTLVGVLPASEGGGTPPGGSFAGAYEWVSGNTAGGGAERGYYTQDAVSSDASRIFFTAGETGRLYVRVNGASTIWVAKSQKTNGSGPEGTDPNGSKPAAYMDATADGSQVFFTSPEELTNAATTGSADQGNDLYRYDLASGALTDLVPDTADPEGADVQGVLGVARNGSYVYFAANGVLAPGASPGTCNGGANKFADSGTCNLYVWHENAIAFIARLNAAENRISSDWSDANNWYPQFEGNTTKERQSRVTPDGRTLLFGSQEPLTGVQTNDVPEFYRYDANTAQLACVTCSTSGTPPTRRPTLNSIGTTSAPLPPAAFVTHNLSDSGSQVFFESADPLVPQARNGVKNVYEWEADGAGSCRNGPAEGGCLYLISTGSSPDPSYFADASASGDDVFIFTDEALVRQDQDQLVDVYDARVAGGLASQNEPPPAPPCSGPACRPPQGPAPPLPPAGTITFSGPGDPVQAATSAPTPRLTVEARTLRRGVLTLTIRVPAKGMVTAIGARTRKASRVLAAAGTYRLNLKLTPAADRVLHSRHRLAFTVTLRFAPTSGPTSTQTVSIVLRVRK